MAKMFILGIDFECCAQDEENIGNLKRQLAKLFEESLKLTVPDESNVEPLVAACTAKFGDYQWYDLSWFHESFVAC